MKQKKLWDFPIPFVYMTNALHIGHYSCAVLLLFVLTSAVIRLVSRRPSH